MTITARARLRLEELGYLRSQDVTDESTDEGVIRFQKRHGKLFTGGVEGHSGAAATFNGDWGPVSEKLLNMPRDCSCPDIARDKDGNEIAEARWPPSCALELEFSINFIDRGMPGLTSAETRNCVLFALAQLNTMFELVPDRTIQDVVMLEFVRLGGDPDIAIFVLAAGTIAHEILHAMGGNHTPNDPDSVLFPSMRGQYILNQTDVRTCERLGYSKDRPLRIVFVGWQGDRGTEVWAKLGALPGSTLAWSMLKNNSGCSQRAEQKYDSTVMWDKTRINLPQLSPPDLPDSPTPEGSKVVAKFKADKAGQEFLVTTGKTNGGVIEI